MGYPVTVDWQAHKGSKSVTTPTQLARLLNRITAESDSSHPPIVLVENEGGVLGVGIGAPVSTLNHTPPSGDPPYMISVGDEKEGVIDFYYFGHHTQFPVRNTIPNELALKAVLEYAESGHLPGCVIWEPV